MEIEDRLYGLPLAEFMQARDQAARELRKTGEREATERVKALRKPTVAAAAVNRLVRGHRDEVERLLRAAAVLRDAQFSGKGARGDLAAARKDEREALDRLTHIGGEAVRQSLLAAAVDDDAARQVVGRPHPPRPRLRPRDRPRAHRRGVRRHGRAPGDQVARAGGRQPALSAPGLVHIVRFAGQGQADPRRTP